MKLEGKRITIQKWIHAESCVLQVEVEAIIPVDDPTEPCLEPSTLQWLDQLQQMADEGKVEQLQRHGTVYVRQSA